MFLLRLGEGRSHSTLALRLAKLLVGCGCRWGGTGAEDRAAGGGIGVRRQKLGGGGEMRVDAGCWKKGNYTKVLQDRC